MLQHALAECAAMAYACSSTAHWFNLTQAQVTSQGEQRRCNWQHTIGTKRDNHLSTFAEH
jgi:hypothetical protein